MARLWHGNVERKGVQLHCRWQLPRALREERGSTIAVVSSFIQRPVSCFEDRCSAECQVIGQARRAGADCDALCVLRMLPQCWTSEKLQCSMAFYTAAPAARCLRRVSCASRWQPVPAVQRCNIFCRAAARREDIKRPHQHSQSLAYNETDLKCLDEVSGATETGLISAR